MLDSWIDGSPCKPAWLPAPCRDAHFEHAMPKDYTPPAPQLVYRHQFFSEDNNTTELAPHQGLMDDGSSAGATVYYHYTNQAGYEAILASQQITDFHRKQSRPNAKPGVYLTDEALTVEDAKLLFLGADGLYTGRADYVFIILLSCKIQLARTPISSGSSMVEFIYPGTIRFVKARSQLRACDRANDGDAVVLFHGANTFT
jgi:hypothetical protein